MCMLPAKRFVSAIITLGTTALAIGALQSLGTVGSGFGGGVGEVFAGPRIFGVLRDEKKSAEQKARELSPIEGRLTAQEIAGLSEFLKKAEGTLFVATADTMLRCGAGREATSVAEAILSNRECAPGQLVAALCFIGKSAWTPIKGTIRALDNAERELLDRLGNPSSEEELLGILRSRAFVWQKGGWWIFQDPVILQLSELLKNESKEVRGAAALALAGTPTPEYIPSSAVISLAKVLLKSDGDAPIELNALLRRVLGVGSDVDNLQTIRAFWRNWVDVNGVGFDLTWYALRRATASQRLTLHERRFLGRQLMFSSRELGKEEVPKLWADLRKVFDQDKAPVSERCSAWLYPMVVIGARDEKGESAQAALSMLLGMSKDRDPALREWALGQIGNLPRATSPGSRPREVLEEAFRNSSVSAGERAMAAWSLRRAAKGDPKLLEEMVVVAEAFARLPDEAFSSISRARCLALVAGSLTEATGKALPPEPEKWRRALAGSLPPGK